MREKSLAMITTSTRVSVTFPSLYVMLTSSLRPNSDKSRNIDDEESDQLEDDDETNEKSEELENRIRRAFVLLEEASIALASSSKESATNDIEVIPQCVDASMTSDNVYCTLLVPSLAFEFACASPIKRNESDDESKSERSENH